MRDYSCHVDGRIVDLRSRWEDDSAVLVVSDHGARPLMGGICINEWLQTEGYLTLQQQPSSPIPFEQAVVDWKRTKARGAGGYYAPIFMNGRGREPESVYPFTEYESEPTRPSDPP